jgi:hypothetical protein
MCPRFYEVPKPERVATACRKWWDITDRTAPIGPVDTNYPSITDPNIRLVVVLESPSREEVALGYPAVGSTGIRIWQRWHQAQGLKPPAFDPKTDYSLLAQEGIYLTELVRCQANYGDSKDKNSRVKAAWKNGHKDYLRAELRKIAQASPRTPVLFACGSAFKTQVREATRFADEVNLPWFVSYHPIGLDDELVWHYNPLFWKRFSRWPKERGEAFVESQLVLQRLRRTKRLVRVFDD